MLQACSINIIRPRQESSAWTASEVPITMSKSQRGKSDCAHSKKRSGSAYQLQAAVTMLAVKDG